MKTASMIGLIAALATGACAAGKEYAVRNADATIDVSVREEGSRLVTDVCVPSGPLQDAEAELIAAGRFQASVESRYSRKNYPAEEYPQLESEGTLRGFGMSRIIIYDAERFCARYQADNP